MHVGRPLNQVGRETVGHAGERPIEQGQITIPAVRKEPLAIGAE